MKKYIAVTLLFVALATGLFVLRTHTDTVARSGTNTTATISVPALEKETVLAAMQAYASSSDFRYSGKMYPSLGFFVESINGRQNADGYYWTLYVGGKLSGFGASQAEVTPQEKIEWRYQKGVD
jgi:hypothetical protein